MRPRSIWKTLRSGRYALTKDALYQHALFYRDHCGFKPHQIRRVLESAADKEDLDEIIKDIKKGDPHANTRHRRKHHQST